MTDNILKRIIQPSARGRLWQIFLLIIILAIVGGMIDAGKYYNKGTDWIAGKTNEVIKLPHTKEIPFRLGLDLLGGSHLVYQANMSAVSDQDRTSALEGVRDVIERRINVFGVSEPVVQTSVSGGDYNVIVELAGVKDVNEAIQMIGETPLLEFKEQTDQIRQLTDEEKKSLEDFNKQAESKAEEVLGKLISGGDFAELAKQFSQDEASKANGGDLGWIAESDSLNIANIAKTLEKGKFNSELIQGDDGYEIIKLEDKRVKTNPFNENEQEKEVEASHLLICYEGAGGCENGLTKEQAFEKINQLKKQASPMNFAKLVEDNSTEPGAKEGKGYLGWFDKSVMVEPFEKVVFAQKSGTISDVVETEFGYHLIYKQAERSIEEYKVSRILIKTMGEQDIIGGEQEWKNTELTGKNLKRSVVQFNPNDNTPEVSLEFDDEGAKLFEEITDRNVGKPVAIYLDGYPISVPNVNEKITGGKAVITGNFIVKEANLLAQRLNVGALPVPITLVSQQTVGATLGQKSVADSLKAGIFGFILVALFMILFYRLPGLISVFALAIYGILLLAIFKIFHVTLTLSGIAGFIVSMGMAVDANVLIFARMKEELKRGKVLSIAIEEGFGRAWPSIRDSNFSTIITCLILIWMTTSVVKGFAFTLLFGVVMSMFSAIVITRNVLKLVLGKKINEKSWLIGVSKN